MPHPIPANLKMGVQNGTVKRGKGRKKTHKRQEEGTFVCSSAFRWVSLHPFCCYYRGMVLLLLHDCRNSVVHDKKSVQILPDSVLLLGLVIMFNHFWC